MTDPDPGSVSDVTCVHRSISAEIATLEPLLLPANCCFVATAHLNIAVKQIANCVLR